MLVAALLAACKPAVPNGAGVSTPPRGASGVQLFVEPDDGVQPVVRFVNSARQSLDIAMYLLTDRPILSAIEAAQRRGVKVRVMLEEHPYGEGEGNGTTFRRLQAAEIPVRWSPATFQLSHDKYAVADRKESLIGTANWTASAFASNREYGIVDDDTADVEQVAALFDADWNHAAPALGDARVVVSPDNSRAMLTDLIASAKMTLDLEAEELQDSGVEAALGQAARRGVAVRVILPAPSSGTDANAAGQNRVTAEGARVRHLASLYVHAKDIIVDGQEAFVGSENLSKASLDDNREVGLLLGDSTAIQRLEATFTSDWNAAK
jgi:phosphatidylserine/phosphatidylglycerophosphate/cardiolipin synthase-like enzyme